MQPPYRTDDSGLPMLLMTYGDIDMEKDFDKVKNMLYKEVYLSLIHICLSVFAFFPHKLGIIRTRRSILIRSRKQHSQPVMKETVTISES